MGQVVLKGIRKSYGDVQVIKGIDLEVQDGEFLVFVGPSGCGKSTTLRMIAGLEDITAGELTIDGQRVNDMRPADRGTAMVFQSYALYPHMTVGENMGFALKMAGVGKAERNAQVGKTAEILRKPKVFLFDEPLSNLDAALRVNMRIELTRLHQELGTTMIYVTHDQVEAMTMGDRIAVFNKGHVEQLGAPMKLYTRPANEFVATFIGAPKINLVDRPAAGATEAHRALWAAVASHAPAQAQRAGLRPEHLRVVEAGQGIPAHVVLAEHLGDSSIIHLRVEGVADLLIAKVGAADSLVHAGQSVGLAPDAAWALAFDTEHQLMG
jgi:multiple sugar transport system ATP-binding protein